MAIFRWKQRPETGQPLGLTQKQIQDLKNLRATPEFDTFLQIVRDIAEYNGDAMINAKDETDIHERRGFILGLKHIVELVPLVLKRVEQAENERRIEERTGFNTGSFIGSAWFDSVRDWNKADA